MIIIVFIYKHSNSTIARPTTMNVQEQRIRTAAVGTRPGVQVPADLNRKHVQAL